MVKISQEEKKKLKLPIGMRGEKKPTTTLASPSNPVQLTKSQKKRRRRNEKRKNTQTQNPVPAKSVVEKKTTVLQPNKKMEKNTEPSEKKTEYTLEEKLMSVAAAAWGMSRNMPHEIYVKNYNKLLEDMGLGGLKVIYKKEEKTVSPDKKEEKKLEDRRERTASTKQKRVTITDPKEEPDEEMQKEVAVEGKRKRMKSSVAEVPKRKRVVTRSTTSEEDEESTDMDTDSGSEDVFEASGPRFRVKGPWKRNAIVEFRDKQSHAACRFEDDDFYILHSELSRNEILEIATSNPECLDRLE